MYDAINADIERRVRASVVINSRLSEIRRRAMWSDDMETYDEVEALQDLVRRALITREDIG